jgi:threonine synthase
LEVNGTFDDCQYLVKQAFLDKELTAKYNLASANSINIARLIPQSFYYFSAYAQLKALGKPLVFSVPSGNFGNLSAGIMAYRMGLPVERFIAATNINNVVPQYLATSEYMPKPSAETISNAMDVGNPSNFIRMKLLAGEHWERVKALVAGYYYDDTQTRMAMAQVFGDTGYVMCPHTAVAYLGLQDYRQETASEATGVFLSTAHPAKFLEVVENTIGTKVSLPERLEAVLHKPKAAIKMTKEFADFKSYLLG